MNILCSLEKHLGINKQDWTKSKSNSNELERDYHFMEAFVMSLKDFFESYFAHNIIQLGKGNFHLSC